jgi:predicted GIY-YIG superfamily endonuclease
LKLRNIMFTYVLFLENEKYYVGVTNEPKKRFESHFNGNGSAWTRKYPPIEIIEYTRGDFEDEFTMHYMKEYGIENVRGGAFVQIKLPEYQIKTQQDRINNEFKNCFNCGQSGHFVNKCPAKKMEYESASSNESVGSDEIIICYKCGRQGHKSPMCYAKRHVNGKFLN